MRHRFVLIHRLTLPYAYGRRHYDQFPAESKRLERDGMAEDESLFTITESHLDSGMRGIPVGTCKTSFVDPIEGVHYVGYPVEDLADLEEEDVIYLLMNKRLPTEEESEAFRIELAHRAMDMPTGALRVLESLTPGSGHPMDWLSMGIMA